MVPYVSEEAEQKTKFGDRDGNAEFEMLTGLPRINVQ